MLLEVDLRKMESLRAGFLAAQHLCAHPCADAGGGGEARQQDGSHCAAFHTT